jgi:poly(A) polymerase
MSEISQFKPKYDPLNTDSPSTADRRNDDSLRGFMQRHMPLESDAEMNRRNEILEELQRVFKMWVREVAMEVMGMNEDEASDVGGLIFISGSHRLNVRDIGADIDTICVAPRFCTREQFFTSLVKKLEVHPDITGLNAVESAAVPLIELDCRGIDIDFLFAQLGQNTVPDNLDILDDSVLTNLDESTEKSINGPRVTDMISKLVPNFDHFLICLRVVRKWAKARGLYGNRFGYLGGVNFNILVAFICQLYPTASPSLLVGKFFAVYSNWDWESPIQLNEIRDYGETETRAVWKKELHYNEVMPIITPAYPAMNSSYTVSTHTLSIMKAEFNRANIIFKTIPEALKKRDRKKKPLPLSLEQEDSMWYKLFEPTDFFLRYQHYLRLNIIGGSDARAARAWSGFCESRLRRATQVLEVLPLQRPIHLHPVKSKV